MSEYISVQDAVEHLTKVFYALYGAFYPRVVIDEVAKKALSEVPTSKAVPVRKGRWNQDEWSCNCSECGKEAPFWEMSGYYKSNFCPNCGADMRGEDDD